MARFSALAGDGGITCGTVLNWLELDNRGNRLIVTDDSTAINTPAVAAAYATKRYAKQASDEISFEVGKIVLINIDILVVIRRSLINLNHNFKEKYTLGYILAEI